MEALIEVKHFLRESEKTKEIISLDSLQAKYKHKYISLQCLIWVHNMKQSQTWNLNIRD
jgi:hypothetical protein